MDTGLGAKAYAIIEQGKIGMILSSRPTDRRQLIEEAAGITKYKSRRRSAELKLEAAQQNLTRIDDIVFEVEKQRGTLKRQAAKARRYSGCATSCGAGRRCCSRAGTASWRDASRRRARALADAREREAAAAARVAEVEADSGRLRIELAEADSARDGGRAKRAHARELDINRRQQQQEFDRQQVETLAVARRRRSTTRCAISRRAASPARIALEARRQAVREAERARDEAAAVLAAAQRGRSRGAARRSKGSKATSRPRAARCLRGARTRRPRCGTRCSTPPPRERVSARRSPSWTSKTTTCASNARRVDGGPRRRPSDALRGRTRPLDACALDRARARVGAGDGARASTSARRARSAPASRSWPASDGAARVARRARRQRAPGSATPRAMVLVAGQRARRPAGRGGRLPRSRSPVRARRRSAASATCCSTSSSSGTIRPRPACRWSASTTPAAAASS